MTASSRIEEHATFSPGLHADNALANYWMGQVTIRLRREILWCWYERGFLPDSSPTSLPPFVDKVPIILNTSRIWEEKKQFFHSDPTAKYLTNLLGDVPFVNMEPVQGSFEWVVQKLDLDDISSFVLALSLVAAFDSTMGSVTAACLNDPAGTRPNLTLAQKLWDHPEEVLRIADPAHPLFRYGLLQLGSQSTHNYAEIDWNSPITVPSLAANQLLFPLMPLPHALVPISQEEDENPVLKCNAHLMASRLCSKSRDQLSVVLLRGAKGSDHIGTINEIKKITKKDVVEFNGDPCLLENSRYLDSIATLCWLREVDLFFSKDLVLSLSSANKHRSDTRMLPLHSIPINVFFAITERDQLTSIPENLLLPIIDVPGLTYHNRMAHWKKVLGPKASGLDDAIIECSRRFRYEKNTIDSIGEGLKRFSNQVSEKELFEACRVEFEIDINELAQKVTPRFEDEELMLPHSQNQLFQEIIKAMKSLTEVHYGWGTQRVWNESGISVLFAGPSGSGKTMAAEILALKLDLPIYRIDLSQVVNKYIGETEKNLKRLFDAAEISDSILFFDEADSIFGRRTEVKDAHDRYANLEISYLLERMERFKGLAILATNRKKDIDEAFLRRLRYIIDFPFPDVEQREKIWRQVIPKNVDSSKIDFEFLSGQFQLAGGHIRSIVFNACLQSENRSNLKQLTMEDIIVAVKREYDKLNRAISLEQFGTYAGIIDKLEHEHGRYNN